VITLICWCRKLWQRRAALRWATQPLVDPADKGDGPESVQHGRAMLIWILQQRQTKRSTCRFASASWQSKVSSLLDRPKKNPARTTGHLIPLTKVMVLSQCNTGCAMLIWI